MKEQIKEFNMDKQLNISIYDNEDVDLCSECDEPAEDCICIDDEDEE
ncbi:hypothetical protein [Mesoplasma melaleucae]|uniref:Uncharacterized protein n=1 Tax=Mesoplasma melaleucae TaxID=81459 RepID=A0A2K8NXB0_9MOLU|nr:hypothetical protein [Mesoplasma melaleucae]ATZ17828.1 hypothetical protein EMELA_v1c02550 [Mesoplasma melaleucae]